MAELFGNKLELPRVNVRQNYRSNVEFTRPEEYYRHRIFIPFIDTLIQQLNERFSGETKGAMSGMYVIPSLIEKLPESEMFENYQSDLPSEPSYVMLSILYLKSTQKNSYRLIIVTHTPGDQI